MFSIAAGESSLTRSDSTATQSRKISYTTIDMSKASASLTPEKIALKIGSIKAKIDIETQIKNGAEKMLLALENKKSLQGDDKKAKADLSFKVKDSGAKLELLKTSLMFLILEPYHCSRFVR